MFSTVMSARLRVGLVADIHYASQNYGDRYCTEGLSRLDAAIEEFRRRSVDFVILLGDATEGGQGEEDQLRCVDEVAHRLADSSVEVHFVAGNHDLEDISKRDFYDRMWSAVAYPSDAMQYEYSYAVDRAGIRFVFLDTHFTDDGRDWSRGNFDWDEAHVRSDHLAWAARVAAGAPDSGVILVTHESLDYRRTNGARDPHVIVNHRAVWDAVSHGSENPVRAVFQGHYHPGRLAHFRRVPILTLTAMVDLARPANAFAVAEIEDEAISVSGYGRQHGAQILMAERPTRV